MKNLLWIGDAGCDTGFARCTHKTLPAIRESRNVAVLGINFRGEPNHGYPYPIHPATWLDRDIFGVKRVPEMLRKYRPEVVVIQNDPWNVPAYVQAIDQTTDVPRPVIVGNIAIDSKNCHGAAMNGLDRAIFWTEFARYEAVRGGFQKPSAVIPLGVDLEVYKPGNTLAARKALGLPEFTWNGFIVGNVNRNQPRKRLDLTLQAFAEWVHSKHVNDAFLYLHVAPTGDVGYNIEQLVHYFEVVQRIIYMEPKPFQGAPEEDLARTYQAFDAQLSTSQAEGWALTTLEGMACGIPQIVPGNSALGEWPGECAIQVECRQELVAGVNRMNQIGGTPYVESVVEALDVLYRQDEVRDNYALAGYALAREDRFRWENISRAFAEQIQIAVDEAHG